MTHKFNGFSQEEIQQVAGGAVGARNKKENIKPAFRGTHVGIRRMPDKFFKPTEQARKQPTFTTHANKHIHQQSSGTKQPKTPPPPPLDNSTSLSSIDFEGGLSRSIEEALFYPTLERTNSNAHKPADAQTESNAASKDLHNDSSLINLPSSVSSKGGDDSGLNDSLLLPTPRSELNTASSAESQFKGVSLKDFEKHRRMIEEQNKQKKELLYKAIEHHSQKTAAEARKIAEIKSELGKLDNDLAIDVAILRKQIDNACVNFSHIEKQYMKIEAQFLKAKIDLHNAAEKKELLTEHLCTVIAHNEDRKAQKLTELMEKVGITPTGDYAANFVQTPEK